MTKIARVAIGLSLLASIPATAADLSLHWSEITPTVKGVKTAIVLTNGKRIHCVIAEVRPDALIVDPNRNIARASVAEIRIRKNRIKGRLTGTAVGALFAVPGVAIGDGSAGARAAAALVWIAGGYFVGYAVDRHEIVIKIASDTLATHFEQ